jgi:hypothetical protein
VSPQQEEDKAEHFKLMVLLVVQEAVVVQTIMVVGVLLDLVEQLVHLAKEMLVEIVILKLLLEVVAVEVVLEVQDLLVVQETQEVGLVEMV